MAGWVLICIPLHGQLYDAYRGLSSRRARWDNNHSAFKNVYAMVTMKPVKIERFFDYPFWSLRYAILKIRQHSEWTFGEYLMRLTRETLPSRLSILQEMAIARNGKSNSFFVMPERLCAIQYVSDRKYISGSWHLQRELLQLEQYCNSRALNKAVTSYLVWLPTVLNL